MREKVGAKSSQGSPLGNLLGTPLGIPMGNPTDSPLGGTHNLRRCGGASSRASQKSSVLCDPPGPQRSVSLTMLAPPSPDLQPRMAQLETLEAKMASIEVSLSTTTPRRKKNGSIVTAVAPAAGHAAGPGPGAGAGGGAAAREVDKLRSALRDKENLIQSLRGQLGASPWPGSLQQRPPLSEAERRAALERLSQLHREADSKRTTIKQLKLDLDRLDITDNIDVRIQQAELEYQLGREELNLLSLLEDTRSVTALLEEAERARRNQAANTLFSCVGSQGRAVLVSVQVQYDPKSPQFGAGPRDDTPGLYVQWATDTCGLVKGDRVLEVNGKLVLSKGREELLRLLAVAPDPALLVIAREVRDDPLLARAVAAEREAAGLRADSVRLAHRISYLEDQVSELLGSGSGTGSLGPRRSVSTVIVTASDSGGDLQLFQKGSQAQLVGAGSEARHIHHTSGHQSEQDSDVRRPRRRFATPPGAATRPTPPRKPLRLSLHRAVSLQSVESAPPSTSTHPSAPAPTLPGDKKAPKRNHRGEAPAPSSSSGVGSIRWTGSSPYPLHQVFRSARSSGNLAAERWC